MKRFILCTLAIVLFLGNRCAALDDPAVFLGKHGCLPIAGMKAMRCNILKGDTLSKFARAAYEHGALYTRIKKANPKIVGTRIFAGKTIIIPEPPSVQSVRIVVAPEQYEERARVTTPAPVTPEAISAPAPAMAPALADPPVADVPERNLLRVPPPASTPPLTLPQPKGWYRITVPKNEVPDVREGLFDAVFLDNLKGTGIWDYQKNTRVVIAKNIDDTVIVIASIPKRIRINSILISAGGNFSFSGETIVKYCERIKTEPHRGKKGD